MEPVKVIPCLDMMNGRIVKGVHFQNMVDAGDPAECIARYCEEGADKMWMLDIKASEEGRRTNLEMIRRAAALCTVPLCIGGGIKNLDDVDAVMEAGARKVGIGSAALTNDEVIRRASYKYGPAPSPRLWTCSATRRASTRSWARTRSPRASCSRRGFASSRTGARARSC